MDASGTADDPEARFAVPQRFRTASPWHLLRMLPCVALAVVAVLGGMLLGGALRKQ